MSREARIFSRAINPAQDESDTAGWYDRRDRPRRIYNAAGHYVAYSY